MWRSTPDASDISSRRIWAQSFGMLRHASSAQLRSYPGPDSIVGRVLELGHTQCSRLAASFAIMTQACQPAEAKRGHQPMKNPWFDNQGFRQAEGYMLESSGVQMWCANLHTQNHKTGSAYNKSAMESLGRVPDCIAAKVLRLPLIWNHVAVDMELTMSFNMWRHFGLRQGGGFTNMGLEASVHVWGPPIGWEQASQLSFVNRMRDQTV